MPISTRPPPSTVPTKPAASVIPVWSSNHSEALSWLPAPSSRALMRISRLLLRLSSSEAADFAVASWSVWGIDTCVAGAGASGGVHLDGFLGAHLAGPGHRHREHAEEADAEGAETQPQRPGRQVGQGQGEELRCHRAPRAKIIGSTVTLEWVIFSRNFGRRPVGIRPPRARPWWSKPAEWS